MKILSYLFCFCIIWLCCSKDVGFAQDPTPINPVAEEATKPSVELEWDANTEPDLAGYKLYYGFTSGVYGTHFEAGNRLEWKAVQLEENTTYYFALTAYDTFGNESDYSNEVMYTTGDTTAPGAPQNLREIIKAANVIINAENVVVTEATAPTN